MSGAEIPHKSGVFRVVWIARPLASVDIDIVGKQRCIDYYPIDGGYSRDESRRDRLEGFGYE
jgi:hypothetical protein